MKKLFTFLLIFTTTAAFAEGYQANQQSVKQAGMGHTGTGMKLGAESMHFNPAALVYMNKDVEISAGVAGVVTNVKYKDGAGYSAKTDNPVSTPVYAYVGLSIYRDKLAAGISMTTPYGSSLKWGKNWAGAAAVQDISLRSFVFQPTVSVKIVDGLSLGAGLMVATGKFELSRALMSANRFQQMAAIPGLTPDQIAMIQRYEGLVPVSATLGGTSDVKVGFNVGLMFEPSEQLTLGLSYRSKMKMGMGDGDASLDYASSEVQAFLTAIGQISPTFAIPPMDQGTFTASLPLPSNLTFGIGYKPNDRWDLAFDLQFVGWKAYKELLVHFNETALNIPDIVSPKNYKNTLSYRLGAQYKVTDRFDVRLGAYLDETPVRSNNYNPETPGANKLGLTAGFSFEPVENLSFDFAFTLIKGFKRNGSYTNPIDVSDVFAGEYSSTAYLPAFGVSYKF